MTDSVQNSQDYGYITFPKTRCSPPRFHFFQQVGNHWEDDEGNHYYDIGEIIGIKYVAKNNQPGQWYYQMRYLKCDFNPSLNGKEDECFEAEFRLVADQTSLE
jgi:hypothetical protein